MEKLAPSQDMMALPQAEKVGLSLVSQPHLLLSCPLSPPGCSCCTTTKTSQAVKEAPCLTSDPFDAQQPSDLTSENCNFSFFASVVASPPPFQLLLVTCP